MPRRRAARTRPISAAESTSDSTDADEMTIDEAIRRLTMSTAEHTAARRRGYRSKPHEIQGEHLHEDIPYRMRLQNMRAFFTITAAQESDCNWMPSHRNKLYANVSNYYGVEPEQEPFQRDTFLDVIGVRMFAHGDALNVNQRARLYVHNLVHQTLIIMLNKLYDMHIEAEATDTTAKRNGLIGFNDLIQLSSSNNARMRRYIRRALKEEMRRPQQARAFMNIRRELRRGVTERQVKENDSNAYVFFLIERMPTLFNALLRTYESPSYLMSSLKTDHFDCRFEKQVRRQIDHLWTLPKLITDYYTSIADLQFCSRAVSREKSRDDFDTVVDDDGKEKKGPRIFRSSIRAQRFIEWMGLPPVETDLVYHLDFFCQELIMELVNEALEIRDEDARRFKVAIDPETPLDEDYYRRAHESFLERYNNDPLYIFQTTDPKMRGPGLAEMRRQQQRNLNMEEIVVQGTLWFAADLMKDDNHIEKSAVLMKRTMLRIAQKDVFVRRDGSDMMTCVKEWAKVHRLVCSHAWNMWVGPLARVPGYASGSSSDSISGSDEEENDGDKDFGMEIDDDVIYDPPALDFDDNIMSIQPALIQPMRKR